MQSGRSFLAAVVALVVSTAFAPAILAQSSVHPWPMFGHDQANTGASPYLGISANPSVAWIKVVDYFSESALHTLALSDENVLYIPTYTEGLIAVDAATGDVKWAKKYSYFGDRDVALGEDGTLYGWEHETGTNVRMWARDPSSGTRLWMGSQSTGSSYAYQPKIGFDGTIYGPTPTGIHAYSPDGTLKWLNPDYGSAGDPPAVDGQDNLYLNGGAGCVSLDHNGWLRWEKPYGCDSRMILGPDENLYYTSGGHLYVRDTATGDLVRDKVVDNKIQAIGPDGTLYFGDLYSILATDPEGAEIWEYAPPDGLGGVDKVLLTVDAANRVYATIHHGALALSDAGQLLWQLNPSQLANKGYPFNQPVIGADGSIFLMHTGYVSAITPEPATLSLLAVGLAAAWARKRRVTG